MDQVVHGVALINLFTLAGWVRFPFHFCGGPLVLVDTVAGERWRLGERYYTQKEIDVTADNSIPVCCSREGNSDVLQRSSMAQQPLAIRRQQDGEGLR